MRKKTTLYMVNIFLGLGTSIMLGLFFSCWEIFMYCFQGHDLFCIFTFLFGGPIPWHLFQWPLIFYGLPGGIIAIFIGNFLDFRFAKTTLHEIGFTLMIVILSCFLSFLFIGWLWKW